MNQGSFHDSKLLHFADDLPSQDKYHAAVEAAASMSTAELVEERSCLCDALRLEDEASEDGYGDYKARHRILDLLEIVQERLDIGHLNSTLEQMENRLVNEKGIRVLLAKWQSQLLGMLDHANTQETKWGAVDHIKEVVPELENVCRDCHGLAEHLRQWADQQPVKPGLTESEFFGRLKKRS